MKKVALITGANKGLGFATAKELIQKDYQLVVVGRDPQRIEKAKEDLSSSGGTVECFAADVQNGLDIEDLFSFVSSKFERLDVLINNAGVFLENREIKNSALDVPADLVEETFLINTIGPYRTIQQFVPMMKNQKYGRIVNVSSGMGQLSDMGPGFPAYRVSKSALNAITRIVHAELDPELNVKINSVCPGWVRTDMGGSDASRSLEEGSSGIVWAATLEDAGPSGGFFRDGQPIDW